MSKSIMIDAGHGGTDPGANGFGVEEKDWNLKMSLYQYKRLKELGVKVGITRTGDQSWDSVGRTDLIKNQFDLCISNHFNAYNGTARGVETIHSIHSNAKFATDLAAGIRSVSGLPLRRVFTRKSGSKDYYFMHRLTGNTETVIIEYGFIDNVTDHNYYKNDEQFYKVAESVVKVVCETVGVKYQPVKKEPVTKPAAAAKKYHKVQVGAFSNKENAENLMKELKKDGYASYVVYE